MVGGRNIQRWEVVSHEFMLISHKYDTLYGLGEVIFSREDPKTDE